MEKFSKKFLKKVDDSLFELSNTLTDSKLNRDRIIILDNADAEVLEEFIAGCLTNLSKKGK